MHVFFLNEILCESRELVFPDAFLVLLGKVCSRHRCQSLEVLLESHLMYGVDGREKEPNQSKFSF